MQKLQACQLLMVHMANSKSSHIAQQNMFNAIFSSSNDFRLDMLSSLTSMAIGVGCGSLLNLVAVWIQVCDTKCFHIHMKWLLHDKKHPLSVD